MSTLASNPNPSPLCTDDRRTPELACRLIVPHTLPSQPLSSRKPARLSLICTLPSPAAQLLWPLLCSVHAAGPGHPSKSEKPRKEGPMSPRSNTAPSVSGLSFGPLGQQDMDKSKAGSWGVWRRIRSKPKPQAPQEGQEVRKAACRGLTGLVAGRWPGEERRS